MFITIEDITSLNDFKKLNISYDILNKIADDANNFVNTHLIYDDHPATEDDIKKLTDNEIKNLRLYAFAYVYGELQAYKNNLTSL